MQLMLRIAGVLALVACAAPPRPIQTASWVELRETAPPSESAVEIELRLRSDGRLSSRYEGGRLNTSLHMAVGEWVHLRISAPGVEPGRARTFEAPDIGWTLSARRGAEVHRWARARRPFDARMLCESGCAARHASAVTAVLPDEFHFIERTYDPWMPDGMTLAQWGAQLAHANGCHACHGSEAGELGDIWGSERTLPRGRTIVVRGQPGRDYLRGFIREPGRYQSRADSIAMPPFNLANGEIDAIVEFLRCGDVKVCPPEDPRTEPVEWEPSPTGHPAPAALEL